MKKALIVASVVRFLSFERNDIKLLREMGYEVHCATNLIGEKEKTKKIEMVRHHIDFTRSPISLGNIKAYFQVRKLMKEENFDLVHCHTPAAGVIARLCANKYRKKGRLKVIYTAHGFHFFKGAPIKNWLLFYPIEWLCSFMTDVLITINKEDYKRASGRFHADNTFYIPGVGLDTEKFDKCTKSKEEKRRELKISDDSFVLLSVGELASRKNQKVVIDALGKIHNKNIIYLMAGSGNLENIYKELIKKYDLEGSIILLGLRNDIEELCVCADCFVHPSIREGLGIAPLEGMASGLPLISSYVNGIKDYTENKKTGLCLSPLDVDEFADAIKYMYDNDAFRKECGIYNRIKAKEFDIKEVESIMRKIYLSISNYSSLLKE